MLWWKVQRLHKRLFQCLFSLVDACGMFDVFQPYYHQWLMHVLTCMARPPEKEVPMSYYDFMTKDSVSTFIVSAVILLLFFLFLLSFLLFSLFLLSFLLFFPSLVLVIFFTVLFSFFVFFLCFVFCLVHIFLINFPLFHSNSRLG